MITIIGGSGFIGENLSQIMNSDKKGFINIDIEAPKRFVDHHRSGDVTDLNGCEELVKNCHQIINLTAKHQDNVRPIDLYYSVNVEGAKQVTSLAERHGIPKIIFTSSAAVYGIHNEIVDEESEFRPFNHYGKSKLQAEQVYLDWQRRTGGCLIIIRPTVVFGEGNRGNVYNLLRLLNDGNFRMAGNGSNKKSMAYVGNVAAFIKYCAEEINDGLHIYNYTDGPDMTMNQLVELVSGHIDRDISFTRVPYILGLFAGYGFDAISLISGKTFPISAVRVKKFCTTTQFSSEKMEQTGFKREFSLVQGLERTLHYEFGKLTLSN